MKRNAYVRKELRTYIFTLDKKRAKWPLSVESNADVSWEDSDLCRIINDFEPGDILSIGDIRDLGRNITEALEILSAIFERGAVLEVVTGSLVFDPASVCAFWSRLFLELVDVEKRRRSERTRVALARKKKEGVRLGTPPGIRRSKLDKHKKQIQEQLRQGITQKFLAGKYKVKPATVSYWMKKNGIKKSS